MKIGIIGFGNMGSAIADLIKQDYTVLCFDKDNSRTQGHSGIEIAASSKDLARQAEVVILAVKPQDFPALLEEIKDCVKNKLVISIAAGISCGYAEKILGKVRLIRAMPNIGAKIGKSVTCICKGSFAADEDLSSAREIFKNIGEVQDLNEGLMNAATAISGSGPAYYFHAIENNPEGYKNNHKKFHEDFVSSLSKAARDIGFDEKTAQFLAHWTLVYSDLLLKETGLAPDKLRKQVTSKGGTTEAALETLHKGGSLVEAVKAAVQRAEELARR